MELSKKQKLIDAIIVLQDECNKCDRCENCELFVKDGRTNCVLQNNSPLAWEREVKKIIRSK